MWLEGLQVALRRGLVRTEQQPDLDDGSRQLPQPEGVGPGLEVHLDPDPNPYLDPLLYAHELGLMNQGLTTAAGRILTRLRGRDAVRWVLTLEVLESAGPKDIWRISRTTAEVLLRDTIVADDPSEALLENCRRLEQLGLLKLTEAHEPGQLMKIEATLNPDGAELLQEVLSPTNPARAAAGALLQEEWARAVTGQDTLSASDRRAAEWVVETMAHGLRNALGPVSFALDTLNTATAQSDLRTVRTGVRRAMKLVDDLVKLYRDAHQPPESFALVAALGDAALEANGGTVTLDLTAAEGAQIRGHRLRLVHAVVELIRNARQHPRSEIAVQVVLRAQRAGARVRVMVEDDGAGIPEQLRGRIFEAGFSTRPTGTGQGLALVREVVEKELSGQVSVDESRQGGARFVLDLPVSEGVE